MASMVKTMRLYVKPAPRRRGREPMIARAGEAGRGVGARAGRPEDRARRSRAGCILRGFPAGGDGMGKLDGKAVVVTGASRGIGADIARLFAAEGGRVVCAARTLREGDHPLAGSLEGTVGEIRAAGGEATAVTTDISEVSGCERLMEEARRAYGPVDVLVNNAALTYFIATHDYPVNKWLRSWAVNLHAPFILSKLALGDMIPRRRGSIVNISSGSAIGPGRGPYPEPERYRGGTCYGAQKAALERFTQGLAREVYSLRDLGHRGGPVPGRAHARYGAPQAGQRPGRPARRAPHPDGPRRLAPRHRTLRPRHRPRHLQPADPQGVRLDRRGARARGGLAGQWLLGGLA